MPDDQYYHDLAYARAQQKETGEIKDIAKKTVRPPSGGTYAFLYGLAILGDLIDLLDLTGIGALISFIVDLFIGAILFFTGRAARDRMRSMNEFQDSLHGHIERLEKKIVAYRNAYARILRVSRKVKILRKPVRKLALKLSRLRKSVVRSPLGRTMAAAGLDLVPFLGLVPWRTWSIYMLRRDEMRAFEEAQSMLPEYMSTKADEIEANNDLQEAETIEAGIEEQPA